MRSGFFPRRKTKEQFKRQKLLSGFKLHRYNGGWICYLVGMWLVVGSLSSKFSNSCCLIRNFGASASSLGTVRIRPFQCTSIQRRTLPWSVISTPKCAGAFVPGRSQKASAQRPFSKELANSNGKKYNFIATSSLSSLSSLPTTIDEDPNPSPQHVVLVGGGHAHVQVIKSLHQYIAKKNDFTVTLVDCQKSASYSGMVPGCVAGLYEPHETLIALDSLADWAGTKFIYGSVVDVDLDSQTLFIDLISDDKEETSLSISYDVVSFDIGSASRGIDIVPGVKDYAIPTRPISDLVHRVHIAGETLNLQQQQQPNEVRMVVVGGGAAGIELSMAMRARWAPLLSKQVSNCFTITIVDPSPTLLPNESSYCRDALLEELNQRNIHVQNGWIVEQITTDAVHLSNRNDEKMILPCTHCLWAAGASSHTLANETLRRRGLALTEQGWIRVRSTLQSTSHDNVFAAGDCAHFEKKEDDGDVRIIPKAGVYAVRCGPILVENLTKFVRSSNKNSRGKDEEHQESFNEEDLLIEYKPQNDFLKLIMCGDGKAVGFRFGRPMRGKWVWELKDTIDRMFMDLFDTNKLPPLVDNDGVLETSQYDASMINRPKRLSSMDAAVLLQRTDDDVDFQRAWDTLRDMMDNDVYKDEVLSHMDR